MFRTLLNGMLACTAVVAVAALAYAEETVIEKHTVESQHEVVAPPPVEHRVEERTVTQQPAMVKKRTDTVVTHERDNDNDDNENDND